MIYGRKGGAGHSSRYAAELVTRKMFTRGLRTELSLFGGSRPLSAPSKITAGWCARDFAFSSAGSGKVCEILALFGLRLITGAKADVSVNCRNHCRSSPREQAAGQT